MASSMSLTVTIGSKGPNISSCISLEWGGTSFSTVGATSRALPSQLQRHRGEVASRSRHHQFTHGAASRVEDVVKPEPEQLLSLCHSTHYDRVQILETNRNV
ncbi:hypothetical protein EYF80_026077 [Liparis tanakae]|uniref:Uncharacterized protein n=1 Tax=Liparis tanakae TaxID=230148 RepID=A0A4Z2HCU9_9TELE|nr:hypothetical protein EYF80_026077 [Liparis tanakae]